MDDRSIKESIKKIRLASGLSQEAMADEMAIGPSTYSKFESGPKEIICKSLYKFSEATGKSVIEIISGADAGVLRDAQQEARALEEQKRFYEEKLSEKDVRIRELEDSIANLNAYIKLLKK